MKMKKLLIKDYVGMTLGIFLLAVSLNMFLVPNKVAAGGISGFATVLYHLTGWPVGVVMLVFNIPLFLIGVKILGARYGLNTLYGAAMLSIFIDVTAPYTPVMTHDLLLASIYGGVVGGIGCGLIFRFKGNTAGTALLAAILNKMFHIRIGQALLLSDFGVIVFAGVVFKSPELALYALISIFVCAQIIDLVQEGLRIQIIDSQNRVTPEHRIVQQPGETWIARTKEDTREWPQGVRSITVPEHNGHLDLVVLMMLLGKQQVNSIWVEAGPTLAGAFLQAGLVDELLVYVAPKLLGSDARGLFVLPGLEKLADAPQLKFSEIRPVGPDVCLHLTTA